MTGIFLFSSLSAFITNLAMPMSSAGTASVKTLTTCIDFTQTNGEIKINQKIYITKMWESFDMTHDCKSRSTPCEMKMKFDNDGEPADPKRYREVVGCLIYVISTYPDLSFIVSKLSQYISLPK